MYSSIGINLNKEAASMMRYKKFPALNHSTKIHTEYSIDNDTNSSNNQQYNKNHSTTSNMEFEFCINGRTYKMNKQNLAVIGFGALVAISAFRTLRSLNKAW